jgi:hypothetical protein
MVVHYLLSDSMDAEFRSFICARYGSRIKKGVFMFELEKAVKRYIATEKVTLNIHAHAPMSTINKQLNIPPKILELKQRIIKFLIDTNRCESEPRYITFKFLKEAISAIKGPDPRTVDKYIKQLKEFHIIRESSDWGGQFAGTAFEFIEESEEEKPQLTHHDELLLQPEYPLQGDLR